MLKATSMPEASVLAGTPDESRAGLTRLPCHIAGSRSEMGVAPLLGTNGQLPQARSTASSCIDHGFYAVLAKL